MSREGSFTVNPVQGRVDLDRMEWGKAEREKGLKIEKVILK